MASLITVQAQVSAGAEGIYIKSGTTFSADGLFMIPSNDLSLLDLKMDKQSTLINWQGQPGIFRLHSFSKPIPFIGTLGLQYQDSELNGNETGKLTLAYTETIFSTNAKDYMLTANSKVQLFDRTISRLFSTPVNLAGLTAVAPKAPLITLVASNIVTPDGDGINDTWVVRGIENYPNNEVKIFDREGRVVYSAFGYKNTWDATLNGNLLPEDTYYYVLYLGQGNEKLTGYISVVRK